MQQPRLHSVMVASRRTPGGLLTIRSASNPSQIPPNDQPSASPDTHSNSSSGESPLADSSQPGLTEAEEAIVQKLRKAFNGGSVLVQDVSGEAHFTRSVLSTLCQPRSFILTAD